MLRQLLLFAMVSVALAAVAIQPLEEKPEEYKDCDGCWVSEIQQFIPTNQSAQTPNFCGEYRCTPDYVQIVSCGVAAVAPPCTLSFDDSLPYPGCCQPIVSCPPDAEPPSVTQTA